MIENVYIEDLESFMEWFTEVNPCEAPDMREALTIFFNLETYDLGAI